MRRRTWLFGCGTGRRNCTDEEPEAVDQLGPARLHHAPLSQSPAAQSRPMIHRRITIHGHQTSLRIEREVWGWLKEIAAEMGVSRMQLIEGIAAAKNPRRSLASEIRVAVAAHFHGAP